MTNDDVHNKMKTTIDLSHPPRWGLLILVVSMIVAYLGLEVLVAFGFVIWRVANHQPILAEALTSSEPLIWANLVAGALGALATICLALAWPRIWSLMTSGDGGGLASWLGWQRPLRLGLWLVAAMTLPFMLLVVLVITQVYGDAKVDVQLQLFATPSLRIATSIVVSTIVPLAEELIFRGAMYNMLLPGATDGVPEWRRQALPLVVTSFLFASAHLLAGFKTAAAIIQVLLLSFYLGALRAVSGSVKSSVTAHVTWNLISALVLATSFNL